MWLKPWHKFPDRDSCRYRAGLSMQHAYGMVQKRHQEEISGAPDDIGAAPTAIEAIREERVRKKSRKAAENEQAVNDLHASSSELQPPKLCRRANRQKTARSKTPISPPTEEHSLRPESSKAPSLSTLSDAPSNASPNVSSDTPTTSKPSQSGKKNNAKKKEKEPMPAWEKAFLAAKTDAEKLEILEKQIGGPQPFPTRLQVPEKVEEKAFPFRNNLLPNPSNLFHRFIPIELFPEIARHTNDYAQQERKKQKEAQKRTKNKRELSSWSDVTAADIGSYFGAVLLLGSQYGGRDIRYYWTNDSNEPQWPISQYFSRTRFQQITRYLKINAAGSILTDKNWWKQVDSIANTFRAATTTQLLQLPTDLSVDEQLIRFKGRSKHTIQMNSKAAGKGFKIYSATTPSGYLIDFRFSSATEKIAEIDEEWENDGWSASEALIMELTTAIQKRFPQKSPYIFHLDNFFTRRKLFQALFDRGIGANGTAKLGSGIPKELAYLKQKKLLKKEKHYGKSYNMVIGDVNCLAVCDMVPTLFMTTIYDITEQPNSVYFDSKKRPGVEPLRLPNPTTNEQPWLYLLQRLLPLHEYNQHMGGSDLHAQNNSYYSVARHRHRRNWWTLLFFLMDAAVTNSFILYKKAMERASEETKKEQLDHVHFQQEIAFQLLRNSLAITRYRPRQQDVTADPFYTVDDDLFEGLIEGHRWANIGLRRQCVVCSLVGQSGRPRKVLGELSSNLPYASRQVKIGTHRTTWICTECQVPICRRSECRGKHVEGGR